MSDAKGNEPPKNTVINQQSTKPVAAGNVPKPDPDHIKAAPKDDEFEKALAEKDGELDPKTEKELAKALGDHSEAEPDEGEKGKTGKDRGIHGRLDAFAEHFGNAKEVITRLVRDVPNDTPDEFVIWGASGHIIRMGHLRQLVMGM